jgi:hypothetical protein
MLKVKIILSLFILSTGLFAKGLPASFKGKVYSPCEVSFVKVLNGKIPSQSKGDASLNLWDERFNPETLMGDIKALPSKKERIEFLEELKRLIHKDQDYLDNLSATVNLMLERKYIDVSDIQKYFVSSKGSKAKFFYSKASKKMTGKLDVDESKISFIEIFVDKFDLSKKLSKEYKDLLLQTNRSVEDLELAIKSGFKLRNNAKSLEQLRHYIEFLEYAKQGRVKQGMKNIENIYNYSYKPSLSIMDSVLPVHKKFLAQKSRLQSFEARRVGEIEKGLKLQMNQNYINDLDDIIRRQKSGEKVDPESLAFLRRKIENSKLSKNLKKRALSQAKGERSIYRKLMGGCGSGNSKRVASAKKKFMRFKFGVGLVGTPLFYYMKNKDKRDTDEYWYEKLGYEWASSIIFSYAGGKLVTGNGGFWKKYLKGFLVFRGMDGVAALSYDTLFGKNKNIREIQKLYRKDDIPENELEKEFNELLKSPTYKKDVQDLLAYLEEKSKVNNTKNFFDQYFHTSTYGSLESNKITVEDLESEEGREVMMELLAERMYLQNMGDWPVFQTGNPGADRWSFYATRATFWDIKGLAFNLALFQIMCREPLGKVGSWGLVIALYLGDSWISGDLTYGYRREAINQ